MGYEKKDTNWKARYILADRVLSIGITEVGTIVFREDCDKYFSTEMSKAEAISELTSIINFIEENDETHKCIVKGKYYF